LGCQPTDFVKYVTCYVIALRASNIADLREVRMTAPPIT
jgi:hypothetical protein